MADSELTHGIIGAAIDVHRALGPGLLESAYEECLCHELGQRVIGFERQKPIPLVYKDVKLECGYRIEVLVGGRIVVEIKAVDALAPIPDAILLTYLRLSGCAVGLLVSFHAMILKRGIRRLVLNHHD
ncbi:MAG TPA: GxxExxY protein [Candidatus Acidoferrales bacterium]|nr:GxxExxY protein [Candidatus Acidoferrales bacterium]